ncbi:MAG: hypothetical protein LBE13_16945 [Bacteroidales bacterium]|jgi:hypothetical protein|nr:hypothetical protein [Bacteroidales bacterium]
MNTLTDREIWDVKKILENKNHFSSLPERRRTAAVSTVAVLASGHNLEYVPETVLNKEICRAALNSKEADCTVLSHIPYPDVQKEGVQRFIASGSPAFVAYSFMDITGAQTAKEAVKADAYCLQLVPDRLITADLCKTALQHPDADKKVLGFIPERFRNPEIEKLAKERFPGKMAAQKEISPPHKKGDFTVSETADGIE